MQAIETKAKVSPLTEGIIADILSQAITGEIMGMSNFASLSTAIDDIHEKMEAIEHANCERRHAEGFMRIAKDLGLEAVINLDGYYWKSIRNFFLQYAEDKDFTACLIIQEVILECFAVSFYRDIGKALKEGIGEFFSAISLEEEDHIEHSIEFLQNEMRNDPVAFCEKVEKIHWQCMNVLAEFTAKVDLKGHCGVCKGSCMKESLHYAHLDLSELRGHALNLYMKTLDRIGLPAEKTLQWVINLPA